MRAIEVSAKPDVVGSRIADGIERGSVSGFVSVEAQGLSALEQLCVILFNHAWKRWVETPTSAMVWN